MALYIYIFTFKVYYGNLYQQVVKIMFKSQDVRTCDLINVIRSGKFAWDRVCKQHALQELLFLDQH